MADLRNPHAKAKEGGHTPETLWETCNTRIFYRGIDTAIRFLFGELWLLKEHGKTRIVNESEVYPGDWYRS